MFHEQAPQRVGCRNQRLRKLSSIQSLILDIVEQRLYVSVHRNIRDIAEHAGVVSEQEDAGSGQELGKEGSGPEGPVVVGPRVAGMLRYY